ncbi:serine-rich adhesin for platelets-like [Impatiens glandulifera]|uniref:serine-rich adhesin for platelets-like n=1 Tax=Impatiens glandulifera TaxID=253017 RepID=UPI001FB1443A|nr:serine-rich adhesin for platelets-like [Impatiens glandulifera]
MTDDDGYGNKAPGVVARLMGLDSLPTSYFGEPCATTPFLDSQSLKDHCQTLSGTSIQNSVEIKSQKMINSPIKKFQTEILPPKSAKPIPITQNKLLSPIKSPGFVLLKDASDIMEAAAKIIDPGLQASSSSTSKSKTRLIGSSSVPLKVKDLKEKAEGVQKPSRFPKGQCRSRSSSDDDVNNKGRSISLAVQAKVNVQKREGLSQNAIRSSSGQKEQSIKNQQNCQKKPSTNNSSTSLRQNNNPKQSCLVDKENLPSKKNNHPKQSCLVDKDNLPSKPLSKVQGRRTKPVDSSPGQMKTTVKSKATDHGSKSASLKNRLNEGNSHQEKNDRQISLKSATERSLTRAEENKGKGVDVVSFTFTSPISRSMKSEKPRRASQKNMNGGDGDALSALLEQKLKELTHIVDSNGDYSSSSSIISQDSVSDIESVTTTQISYDSKNQKAAHHHHRLQINEEMNMEPSTMLGKHYPSPISVLESSSLTESCNSSKSITTTTTSSVQADANLSDTDSSTSTIIAPSSGWELEYIKEILLDMEPMFEDYAIGRSQHFVNPQIFHRIENSQKCFYGGDVGKQMRKVLFDFVNESMDLRCRQYTRGGCGYKKGMQTMMRRKEWLAEEVYGEMEGWRGSGDCMVDDLVEKDMSSQFGKWVEFDVAVFEVGVKIEGRILTSLINEVVADIFRL